MNPFSSLTVTHALAISSFLYANVCHAQQDDKLQVQLDKAIKETVDSNSLPGMVATILVDGKQVATAAYGLRSVKEPDNPITKDDKLHLGSCTKAMTATVIAILVDEGKLSWDDTFESRMPDVAAKIDPAYAKVTLWQLLTHRGGIKSAGAFMRKNGAATTKNRKAIVKFSLKKMPKNEKIGRYSYSNLGYLAAGLFIDAATGKSYEEVIQEKLFDPLEMKSAGFGPPTTKTPADQPWGHGFAKGVFSPSEFDNPASMSAAGRAHCAIGDWAKFVALHMDIECKNHMLLKPETLKKLHGADISEGEQYAGGWGFERQTADDYRLDHSGSNTFWICSARVHPKKKVAVLVVCNGALQPSAIHVQMLVAQMTKAALDSL